MVAGSFEGTSTTGDDTDVTGIYNGITCNLVLISFHRRNVPNVTFKWLACHLILRLPFFDPVAKDVKIVLIF